MSGWRKDKLRKLERENNNQILLEPGKYPSLSANLKAQGIDIRPPVIKNMVGQQNAFFDLVAKNDPTQIPFLTTTVGNVLVNPSTVSHDTLQKIATNEVVHKCQLLNVATVVNSLGAVCHDDKKYIQPFLREMYDQNEYGLTDIVEKYMTASIFGNMTGYIRDNIDDDGYTRLEKMDLLPPSTILFTATPRGDVENTFMYVYNFPYANTQNLFSFPFNYDTDFNNIYNGGGNGVDPLAGYGNAGFLLRTNLINFFGLIQLQKERTIRFIWDGTIKVANPYGWNPITRVVYDLVMLYDMYKQLQTTFLTNRACPLIVGYAKANQTVDDPLNPGQSMEAIDGLYKSLQNVGFTGAILLSGLKDDIYHIDAIQTEGNTEAFMDAINWLSKQIEACMGQFSLEESSYASASTQESFYSRSTLYYKDKIANSIVYGLNKYFIQKNFDPNIKNFGYFENQIQSLDDQIKQSKIFNENCSTTGFNPGLIKKDNDYQRTQLKQPLLDNNEFEELKKFNIENNQKPDNSMDNSNKHNTQETKKHYKHEANSGT